jgi:hypothetical protein
VQKTAKFQQLNLEKAISFSPLVTFLYLPIFGPMFPKVIYTPKLHNRLSEKYGQKRP